MAVARWIRPAEVYPTLFTLFGVQHSSYGASKALAALVAALMLRREFRRLGWNPESATTLVIASTVVGFLGAKLYYLGEHAGHLSMHDSGGSGFTWYGGFLAGFGTFLLLARRHHLRLTQLAAASAAPLSVAYGIGRLGCLLAGDGTYGRPTDLPWAMAFPNGTLPTTVAVHPTPLYEALVAFAIAGLLLSVRHRWNHLNVVGTYLILSGLARLLVEFLRINDPVFLGLTQPQLWSIAVATAGLVLIARNRRPVGPPARDSEGARPYLPSRT